MAWPEPLTLSGKHATLVPLDRSHAAALAEAVRDGELWTLWYTSIPSPERMAAEIERRLGLQAQGSMLPFAVNSWPPVHPDWPNPRRVPPMCPPVVSRSPVKTVYGKGYRRPPQPANVS